MSDLQPPTARSGPPPEPSPDQPTFDAIPLSPDLRHAIDALRLHAPHPGPARRVRAGRPRGKNLVVQARTGTGKTAAFGLPILDALVRKSLAEGAGARSSRRRASSRSRSGASSSTSASTAGRSSACIYGGAPMGKQIERSSERRAGRRRHARPRPRPPPPRDARPVEHPHLRPRRGRRDALDGLRQGAPRHRRHAPQGPPGALLQRDHPAGHRAPRALAAQGPRVHHALVATSRRARDQPLRLPPPRRRQARRSSIRILEIEDPESAIIFCNTKDETAAALPRRCRTRGLRRRLAQRRPRADASASA